MRKTHLSLSAVAALIGALALGTGASAQEGPSFIWDFEGPLVDFDSGILVKTSNWGGRTYTFTVGEDTDPGDGTSDESLKQVQMYYPEGQGPDGSVAYNARARGAGNTFEIDSVATGLGFELSWDQTDADPVEEGNQVGPEDAYDLTNRTLYSTLEFDARVGSETAITDWRVRLEDASLEAEYQNRALSFDEVPNLPLTTEWQSYTFNLDDFNLIGTGSQDVDLTQVFRILIFVNGAVTTGQELDLWIDNMIIESTNPTNDVTDWGLY